MAVAGRAVTIVALVAACGGQDEDGWSFVPTPGSRCGYGSTAGIGMNRGSSQNLLVYLSGGGGCWDAKTCCADRSEDCSPSATHLDGYDEGKLHEDLENMGEASVFDRTDAHNPFADWTHVFVPYCTGDFHVGSRVTSYGVYHQGFRNVSLALQYLAAALPRTAHVVVAGSSAGGFGSLFNYEQVQEAFASIPVDVIDDSGAPLPLEVIPAARTMQSDWGSALNAPPGCSSCGEHWDQYVPYLAGAHPASRFSLISSYDDSVISNYFQIPPRTLATGLRALADGVVAPLPNFRVYYLVSTRHGWLDGYTYATSSGVPMPLFLEEEISRAPWASVEP
jgi:hypothetical protein